MSITMQEIDALRQERGPTWCAIFDAMRDYRLSNMVFEGTDESFCLVDLVSTIGGDISTGENELLALADEISLAIDATLAKSALREDGGVVAAWTGSGSLAALLHGGEGHIWPYRSDAHPIALYTDRAALEASTKGRDKP